MKCVRPPGHTAPITKLALFPFVFRYILEVKSVFYQKFLYQPIVQTMAVATTIFCIVMVNISLIFEQVSEKQIDIPQILQTNSTSGYGFVSLNYFHIFFLCYFGNEVKRIVSAMLCPTTY